MTTDLGIDIETLAAVALLKKRKAGATVPESTEEFAARTKILSDDPARPTLIPFQVWNHQRERFEAWDRRESEIILKARQLGMSEAIVMYALKRAMYDNWRVALLSVGQREARELLARCRRAWYSLPLLTRGKALWRIDDVEFATGGRILALPSSEDTGVSYTFQLIVMDELAFHPWGESNYAALRPTISAGGQFIALSTANPRLGPSGLFHDLYFASKRQETPYNAVFIPWDAREGRNEEWLARERAAYSGMPEEFDAFYPETEEEAFVARSGLVFPMFSKERHVKIATTPLAECVRVVAGVDLGGGDPTAVVVLGMDSSHHIHQYAEFYRRGAVGVDDIAEFLLPFQPDSIECPPEQATVIETLRQTFRLNAHAANNKRGDGLNLMASSLWNDQLTIDPSCKDSIAEFPGYRWAERTDPNDKSRYATQTPVNHHADAMDARRYALMEILAYMHSPGAKVPFKAFNTGRPLARKAV